MIKNISFAVAFLLIPFFVSAQTLGDDAPNLSVSECISLSRDMGYRTTDSQSGGEVSLLQDYLQSKGYLNSEPTGFFGNLTTRAAKDFQTANNIRPTGYVGPITRAKIQSLTCSGQSVSNQNTVPSSNDRQLVTGVSNGKVAFSNLPQSVSPQSIFTFNWSVQNNYQPKGKDWIGLVPKGYVWQSGDGAKYSWVYTDGTYSGSKQIKAPSTNGLYELVYFENDLRVEVARSNPFSIGSNQTVNVQRTNSVTPVQTVIGTPTVSLETVSDIKVGQTFTVKWSSTNTKTCSSPNSSISVNGSSTNLPIEGSYTSTLVSGTRPSFQITCSGEGGWTSRSLTIQAIESSVQNTFSGSTSNVSQNDSSAPSTPSNLSAGSITSNSVSLNWGSSSDNVGVIGYRIYRNGTHIASAQSTNYTDNNLSPNTSYSYSIAAYDVAGNLSLMSTSRSVTTLNSTQSITVSGTQTQNTQTTQSIVTTQTTSSAPDTQAPSTPNGLSASSVTSSSFTLSWSASSDNVGVTGYRVYRNGTLISSPSQTSVSITGLSASTAYSMTVSAVDAAGNVSNQSSALSVTTSSAYVAPVAVADTTAPSTPTGLIATPVSTNQINLTWNASSDNVGVTSYKVYSGSSVIATVNSPSYSHTGLQARTNYSYRVSAVDAAQNESPLTSYVNATTQTGFTPASSLTPIDAFTGATFDMSGAGIILTDNPTNCVPTATTGCGRLSGLHQFANSGSNVSVSFNLTGITPRADDSIIVLQYTSSGLVISTEKPIDTPATSGGILIQLPTYVSGTYNGNTRYGLYYLAYVQKTSSNAYRYIDADWIGIYAP